MEGQALVCHRDRWGAAGSTLEGCGGLETWHDGDVQAIRYTDVIDI